ncbi:Tetratricopeptide (TPR) repeat [Saccharopolyspora antimicrobica]|uniref:Tetratricopeptide (TPR) repeat n=1 Tax=Saccharopolyspora antimicrobica TaxID=455193 RepID=A0A1I4XSP2_9PSEU|nr:FxSxx-COOH system tetratricopeptide repeat protein [Saccharopolyspora antimicrobica]RKT84627.1 tetratricopeptide (TPR) repeat protein [Saccharopolyspora antimicrobica]SFN28706.1 Tetratricopeptide (TPR) repeat [Saccharopolyspora antimicrobica]
MQEPTVRNVHSGNARSVVQAGHIHGDVHVHTGTTGPGLGSLTTPALTYDVRGRGRLVAEVVEELNTGQSCVVLHGAGGYGKTTVAQRVAAELDVETWWVDASSEARLQEGMREVALRAGASPEAVREAWDGRGLAPDLLWQQLNRCADRWLLVLDNADDASILGAGRPIAERTGWLRPPGDAGGVLITSRDGNPQAWGGFARLHAVATLSAADGARMLLDRAPDAGAEEQARELALRLGGLPLALHLAGRYLAVIATLPVLPGMDLPVDFAGYRAALDDRWAEVTELPEPSGERETLLRTWELSLDLLAERGHPMARPLLRMVSHFAAAPVPLELLRADIMAGHPWFEGLDAMKAGLAIKALAEVGLVDLEGSGLSLHPVVRETNRHQGGSDERDDHLALFVGLLGVVTSEIDPTDPAEWPRWRALLPHCAAVSDVVPEIGGDEEWLVPIAVTCARASRFCSGARLTRQGIDLVRHALANIGAPDAVLRPVLSMRNDLAGMLRDRGELTAAEAECRSVLAEAVRILGAVDADVLGARNNLAVVLRYRGDLVAAEAEFRAVVETATEILGAEHPGTLSARDNLAGVLQELLRWPEAEAEVRAVLRLRSEVLGPDHRGTVITRSHLAGVLGAKGDFAAAEDELRIALESSTRVLGPEHGDTLGLRHNLASVLKNQGDLVGAEAELRAVLEIAESVMEAEHHPDTLTTRHTLAGVLREQGDLVAAEAEYRALLEVLNDAEGPDVVPTRHNLAAVLRERGDLAGAEDELRAALAIAEQRLGAEHPMSLVVRFNLTNVLRERGKTDEAVAELRTLLELSRRSLGEDHPDTRATEAQLNAMLQ